MIKTILSFFGYIKITREVVQLAETIKFQIKRGKIKEALRGMESLIEYLRSLD